MTGRGLGRGRGRRPVTGTEEEQAALVADSNNVILSDSDLSFSSGSDSDGGEAADESKSTSNSSGGKGVKSEVRAAVRKPKGRGRGRPLMQPPSYSSSSLSSSDLSLEEDLEKMSVTVQLEKSSDESVLSLTLPPAPQPVSEYLPPQPRITGLFPGGKEGSRPCKLQANHFTVSLNVPEGMIYMYDVTIVPPWTREYKRTDKKLYHDTISKWKEAVPAIRDHSHAWVFDGCKQLYSTKKLSSDSIPQMTRISLWSREDEREVAMVVRDVTRVADIRVTREILEWAASGRSGWAPQDALQALDVVLKQALNLDIHFENIGRSYFPTKGETLDVGFGKEVWIGTFSSLRPVGWKDAEVLLTLNVDTASKPGTKNLHLTKESVAGKGDSYIQEVLAAGRKRVVNLQGLTLTEDQRKVVSRDLEGLKVKYEMPTSEGGMRKRQYRVLELRRKPANQELITLKEEDGKEVKVSVADYFKQQYGVELKWPGLPCLWVGSRDKTTYIPVEFCTMMSQPLPKRKKLEDDAVAKMIKQTAVKPLERQAKIMEGLKMNNNTYKKDPFANEFGISVSGEVSHFFSFYILVPNMFLYLSRAFIISELLQFVSNLFDESPS